MDYVGYLSQDYHHNPVSSIILKERTIRNSRRFQTVEDDSDMFWCSFNTQSFSHLWGSHLYPTAKYGQQGRLIWF